MGPLLAMGVAVSMGINALMIFPSLYMLQIYDRVMVSQNALTLVVFTAMLVVALVLVAVLENWRTGHLVKVGMAMDERLASPVFAANLQAELNHPTNQPQQALTDLNQLRQFVTGQGIFVFFDLPWFPIYVAVMFLLHPYLGLVGLVFCVVSLGVSGWGHRANAQPIERAGEASRRALGDYTANLRNAETIHAMGMLPALRQRWSQRFALHGLAQSRVESTGTQFSSFSKYVKNIQQTVTLGLGAWLVVQGELTPGAMIAANMLMTKALQPLDLLVSTWSSFLMTRLSVQRLEALLQQARQQPAGDVIREHKDGELQTRRLQLNLPNGTALLKGVDLTFPQGTVTGVVGPSGSGKSTLAKALLGLWPQALCSGQIVCDGVSVWDWDRQHLGARIGYLPQDIALLEGSLADNIARHGRVNDAWVIEAAQQAGIHEMILRLPNGYETAAGEAGQFLSGGQRQLIGLARAIYGKPRWVVLDEPNANLDEWGDACLIRAVEALKAQGSVVILISHRPEILNSVDQTLRLHGGGVTLEKNPLRVAQVVT
jgi:ATP-binding cassette subfamily C exporter for protease/lipase